VVFRYSGFATTLPEASIEFHANHAENRAAVEEPFSPISVHA